MAIPYSVFLVFFIVGIDYLFYQLPKDVEICDLMPNFMHVCCCKIIMRAEKIINVINSRPWTIYGIYQYTNNNVSIHRQPVTIWKAPWSIVLRTEQYLDKNETNELSNNNDSLWNSSHKFLPSNCRNI